MKKIYSCSQNPGRQNTLKRRTLWTIIFSALIVFGGNASFAQAWNLLGNAGFSMGQANFTSMAINGSGVPYVAYEDYGNSGKASVKKYNGSSWVAVGATGFSAAEADYVSLAIDGGGTPYVAYRDAGYGYRAIVKKYDGTNWVTVGGATLSSGWADYESLAIDNSDTLYIAYADGNNSEKVTVKKYNGSSWVTVGYTGFSSDDAQWISLAIKGSTPYIAYCDLGSSSKVTLQKYSGGSWSVVGSAGFSAGWTMYTSLAIDASGSPYVSYFDGDNGSRATVQKFIATAPPPISGSSGICVAATSTMTNAESGGTWSSSNASVATVGSSSGVVNGIALGTAIISYSNSSGAATKLVAVQAAPVAGTISGPTSVCEGKSIYLITTGTGGTWSSASTGVATMWYGSVTGVAAGTAVMSYTVSNGCGVIAATKIVTVNVTPPAISGASAVYVGNTTSLGNALGGGTWSTDNPTVAAIDTSGVVTGLFNGNAFMMYTLPSGCGASKMVAVNDSAVPTPIISRFAGETTGGYNGEDYFANVMQIYSPAQITSDAAGNVYFAEVYNSRVRKVDPSGMLRAVAGNGIFADAGDGGPATAAILSYPQGVATDAAGNIYIGDTWNNKVRKINTSGIITTVVGTGDPGYNGDGILAASAKLRNPTYLHIDASGNMFICDNGGFRVRKVNPAGIISTIAGTGTIGYSGDGGPATAAQVGYTGGVWSDNAGNVYIADATNHRVRKVNSAGVISTVAGNGVAGSTGDGGPATAAKLNQPQGVFGDASNNIYVAEVNGNRIRKINPAGIISTVAGTGVAGYSGDGGPATAAQMAGTNCVYISPAGSMYISEGTGHRIRKVDLFTQITGPALVCVGTTATLSNSSPAGTWSSSNVAVGSINASSGIITGLSSGTATISYSYSGGIATRIITVNTTPTVNAIAGTTSVCVGARTTLANSTPGGTWTSGDVGIATVGISNGVVSGVAFGTTLISYTINNGCGTITTSSTATVNAAPNASSITGTATICSGGVTTLSNLHLAAAGQAGQPVLRQWMEAELLLRLRQVQQQCLIR